MSQSDFRYDEGTIRPAKRVLRPIGTLAELKEEGIDPAVVPCCHEEVKNGTQVVIKGCAFHDGRCQLAIRGESGPQFFGVEVLKGPAQEGASLYGIRDCFYIAQHKAQIEHPDNEGVMNIIAREGEKMRMVVVGPETGYKDAIKEVEVPHFPRPNENPDVAKMRLQAMVRKEAKQDRDTRTRKRNLAAATNVLAQAKQEGTSSD